LFGESGLEDPRFKDASMHKLSNSMGLYLQKTNIIRDYLEDISEKPPRIFYPRDIWCLYAKDIADLKEWENRDAAVACLNHMITDAMKHAVDCLDYLKMLKDPTVFKFCAIPQVMAIATLELCYNNHDVFRFEVKIRKGQALQLILNSKDYKSVCKYFLDFARRLEKKIPASDKNGSALRGMITQVKARCISELGQ
jgi:farnesyl-diphosphate farnesyltransferase